MSEDFVPCPSCGAPSVTFTDGDGQTRYQPADDDDVGCELSRIETDMMEISDALAAAGFPGAINAESILDRIAALAARP